MYKCLIIFSFAIPCLITLSTLIPGLSLVFASILYLISSIKNERWHLIDLKKTKRDPKVVKIPDYPPPVNIDQIVGSFNDKGQLYL